MSDNKNLICHEQERESRTVPMTDAEIEAFMSAPSKYGVPPIATPQQEPRYTIPQFIQILAKAGGYKVILEKM